MINYPYLHKIFLLLRFGEDEYKICERGFIKIKSFYLRMMSLSLIFFMDSDRKDDPFLGLLHTSTIRVDPDAESVDEYVKYINKDRDEDIHNPLQWWPSVNLP